MDPLQPADPHQESPLTGPPLPLSPRSTKPSNSCHSVLRLSLVENLPRPKTDASASIVFRSPIPDSMGMRTAREWHREQLLQYRLRWEERCRQRIKEGLTPTTLTTSRICDLAQEDVALLNTATDIPPHHRRQHPYLSDLDPYSPDAWSTLTSTVRKQHVWSIDCPLSSKKTTKIPLRFRRPTLPKGWVYHEEPEEVADAAEPSHLPLPSSTITPPLLPSVGPRRTTRGVHRRLSQRALNTTGGLPMSLSTSPTTTGEKSRRDTSRST